MMKRNDFIDYYETELEFLSTRGIVVSKGHAKELREMFAIYNRTKTDAEFTEQMNRAGYGVIK